jgi:polyisoprenoid-binding protein YceI
MKPSVNILVVIMVICAFSSPVLAAAPQWDLDPAHVGIYFSIDHIYSKTRGYFEDFKGTVIFSPDDLAGSRFDFEVDVKSINTANSKRDGHLQTADFFDSKKYPKMTFTSTAVEHVKDDQYLVKGKMTIKDVSKDISVPFRFLGSKTLPFDKDKMVAGFEARMAVDRLAWNVGGGKYYEMGVIGKDVDVLITLEVIRDK